MGLVVLGLIYYTYYSWNCFDCDTGQRLIDRARLNNRILVDFIAISIFLFATVFLSRLQRMIVFPWSIFLIGIIAKPYGYYHIVPNYLHITGLISGTSFFLGNLLIFIKYGKKTKPISHLKSLRNSLSWGILGFALFLTPDFHQCGPITAGVSNCPRIPRYDVLKRVFSFINLKIYGHDYYYGELTLVVIIVSFALIGFALEKYNQRKVS
jgi:hypothetical protein